MVKSERKEGWLRIVVAIITGIILKFWGIAVLIVAVINWLITVITGKRNKGLADFCEYWNTETYRYIRYLTSVTNERPFPFTPMPKERISDFSK